MSACWHRSPTQTRSPSRRVLIAKLPAMWHLSVACADRASIIADQGLPSRCISRRSTHSMATHAVASGQVSRRGRPSLRLGRDTCCHPELRYAGTQPHNGGCILVLRLCIPLSCVASNLKSAAQAQAIAGTACWCKARTFGFDPQCCRHAALLAVEQGQRMISAHCLLLKQTPLPSC